MKKKILFIFVGIMLLLVVVGCNSSTATEEAVQKSDEIMSEKEAILFKMLNVVDNFETAQGNFEATSKNGDFRSIDFYVDVIHKLSKVTDQKEINILTTDSCYRFFINDKRWIKCQKKEDIKTGTETMTLQERLSSNDGRRSNIVLDGLSPLFDFQESILLFKNDIKNISITSEEKFLDRDVYIIEWPKNETSNDIIKVDSYKIYVDKETGIILQLVKYLEGEVVEKIQMTSFDLNKSIPENVWEVSFEGYTEVTVETLVDEKNRNDNVKVTTD